MVLFCEVYRFSSVDALREEVDKVLRHEFTHHLENLSNLRDLEEFDKDQIEKYKNKYK